VLQVQQLDVNSVSLARPAHLLSELLGGKQGAAPSQSPALNCRAVILAAGFEIGGEDRRPTILGRLRNAEPTACNWAQFVT